ncbi:hypothetical protein Gpo141_00000437 [Globisporangium polare]
MATAALEDALKDDALRTFTRALSDVLAALEHGVQSASRSRKVLLAVDASHHVIFQVLASGAGGKAFYDQLNIDRLVSIDTNAMDATAVQGRIGGGITSPDPVVFVVPPKPTTVKLIADSVRSLEGTRRCCVLWLPAATSECTLEMERQGVAGFVAQRNLSLGLIPIDDHVAALCHDAVFGELYVKGDHRSLTDVVRSVLTIEKHAGARIEDVVCHGEFANRVRNMLQLAHSAMTPSQQRRSTVTPTSLQPSTGITSTTIHKLILLDRMQDPLSMLLTPMTYEGLLDALLNVNHGVISYASAAAADKSDDSASSTTITAQKTLILNSRDELYSDIRDVNFNILISRMLVDITQDLISQARINGTALTSADSSSSLNSSSNNNGPQPNQAAVAFAQVSALLKKVPNLVKKKQSLAHHLQLVHQIRELSAEFALRGCVETEMALLSASKSETRDADRFLEEAILRDPPLQFYDVVKLLCLCSLVRGGLKPERLSWYRKQLCHTYGHAMVLPLLLQLEKLDLLSTANKFDFPRIKKKFALLHGPLDDSDTLVPRDIHFMFPYTGYAPMSVRLVQDTLAIKYKISPLAGILAGSGNNNSKASASSASISSNGSASTASVSSADLKRGLSQQGLQQQQVNVLVYYVGGVTVAELAAYRFLNQKQTQYEFMVAATSICNGNRLLRAI